MDDGYFINRHSHWDWMAAQTARRLERQIGRPQSEFNRDCLKQEMLWQVCVALRRGGVKNEPGLATTVVRNRARDILRRARACRRRRNTVSLGDCDEEVFADLRAKRNTRISEMKDRIERVVLTLPEIQRLAVATACEGEATAATAIGISRRQLRKVRSAVRDEFERHGLREFL